VKFPRAPFPLLILLALVLYASVLRAQDTPVFRDPAAPLDARIKDLIGRMTLQEKIDQLSSTAPAIPRLEVPAYDWWNEALHGVARAGRATICVGQGGDSRTVSRADVLDAEHQHLPRSAMGPKAMRSRRPRVAIGRI
jgi:hypothetical protein